MRTSPKNCFKRTHKRRYKIHTRKGNENNHIDKHQSNLMRSLKR